MMRLFWHFLFCPRQQQDDKDGYDADHPPLFDQLTPAAEADFLCVTLS